MSRPATIAGGDGWQPIETIPDDRPVEVESVSGIICLVRLSRNSWLSERDNMGPRRMRHCRRIDGGRSGDVAAIRWREPHA